MKNNYLKTLQDLIISINNLYFKLVQRLTKPKVLFITTLLILGGCSTFTPYPGGRVGTKINSNGYCQIIVSGEINDVVESSFYSSAAQFKQANCKQKVLIINSDGAPLDSGDQGIELAMRIGKVVRADGFETRTVGLCNGACTYIYVAGFPRLIWGENKFGFYQRRDADGSCPNKTPAFLKKEKEYLNQMLDQNAAAKFIEFRQQGFCDVYKAKIPATTMMNIGIATGYNTLANALF